PPTQAPAPLQVSLVVHALPSLQAPVLFRCLQPVAGSQESVVQALPSLQLTGVPPQAPFAQMSPLVQALLSLQGREFGVNTHPFVALHASVVQRLPSSHGRIGPLPSMLAQLPRTPVATSSKRSSAALPVPSSSTPPPGVVG